MPISNSLTEAQLRAIQILVYQRKNKGETARIVGVTPDAVSDWFKSKRFIDALQDEMRFSFQEIALEAKEVQLDLMRNAQSENVKATLTRDFLSRAGYDATTKTENTNTEVVVEFKKKDESKD